MATARIFVTVAAVTMGPIYAQAPVTPTAIIASIKPNNDVNARTLMDTLPGGRFTGTAVTVTALLRAAYQVQPRDIAGAPAWFGTKRYDIAAKAESGEPRPPELLQALLKERFALQVHREKREQQAYALVLARNDGKLGPKLTASSFDCAAYLATPHAPDPRQTPQCGARVNPRNLSARAISMAQLANFLVPAVGRTTIDKTGVKGLYDVDLVWTPDPPAGAPVAADATPNDGASPSIFTAVQEQLGLKLVSDKALVDMLIVDRANEPTEN
jgi:uncharacterized protein (TIGR03435 family)